ncbi:MAG: hypothetical protein IGS48_13110 [Oscillatoriales cyanobacterium C42_A2020_001]|nr:hypothetical protein [Leptolyngbyaceae cyanobacterium C42_A2020_001]
MNILSFHPATQSDADAIAQVYLSSRRAFVSFAAIAHSEEAVHQWIRDILIPESQVTVVERDNRIVGMMALSTTEEDELISFIYILMPLSRKLKSN